MRSWLLLLAVLATFLTIVQVASTEDITARFLTAITPIEQTTIAKQTTKKDHSSHSNNNNNCNNKSNNNSNRHKYNHQKKVTATSTALAKAPQPLFVEQRTSDNQLPAETTAAQKLFYKNSVSVQETSDIIEIKSIQNEVNKVQQQQQKQKQKHKQKLKAKHRAAELELKQVEQVKSVTEQLEQSQPKQETQMTGEKLLQNQIAVEAKEEEEQQQQQQQQHQHQQRRQHHHKQQHHHHHRHRQHHKPEVEPIVLQGIETESQGVRAAAPAADLTISSAVPASLSSAAASSSVEILASMEVPANAAAVIVEDEPATYSNKEIIKDKLKPDPSTLVEIENSLLSLFNMKRPPKIDRTKIIIPEAMKQLYAQIMGHELDSVNIPRPGLLTKSANTVRSFTHKDSKIDDRFPHHHRFRLHFDIKSIPSEEKLKAAELQLTRDAINHATLNPRQANRTRYQVLVYDITRVGVRGKREPNYLLLDSKTVRLNSTDILSLDVQPAVDRWLATPQKNYGLLVEVRTMRSLKPAPHHHVRLRRSADETLDTWQHKQPLLFTYTDDGRHKSRSIRDVSNRSKRAGHHRRPYRRKSNEEICRRHSLYVDFADVGWSDWIVAPPGYDAFYCHGKCPFPLADHLNSTNHAVVQTLVNNLNPGKVPKACCVPTQLEGISMLYLNDQSTVVLKNYQDMTVVGCGCR